MKFLNKMSPWGLTAIGFLSASLPALAADVSVCPDGNFYTLCDTTFTANDIVRTVVQILLIAAVVIALVFLIWGGIKWILSGGDKGKVEAARNTIIGAIIGLVIAFAAFFILNIVANLFGIGGGILNLTLPSFTPNHY